MKGSEFRKKIKSRPRLLIEKKDEIKGIEDEIVYRTVILLRKVYKVISSIFGQPFKKIPNKTMGMLPANIRKKVKTELERVTSSSGPSTSFGYLAITLAAVNIFGGFLVTQRMLAMYKKKKKDKK